MLKSIAAWICRKYAVGVVQDLVKAKSGEVADWSYRIHEWILRLSSIVRFLDDVAVSLKDGELTDNEAKYIVDNAKALAESVTKKVEVE